MNYYFSVLKNYANFKGRARRKEYWMFTLFHVIIAYVLAFSSIKFPSALIVYLIYLFATLLPAIAVGVRRMHDVGKSGWYLIIPIYSLILACTNGEEGKNQYGEDPKGAGSEINDIGISQE